MIKFHTSVSAFELPPQENFSIVGARVQEANKCNATRIFYVCTNCIDIYIKNKSKYIQLSPLKLCLQMKA